MQFKGVNNKERQQCPRLEVSFKRMRNCAVFPSCGVRLAVRGVLSASVAESSRHLALLPFLSTVFFFSMWRVPFFSVSCAWGLMAGLQRCASHGGVFSLGAGCQKWKPLDILGTQPPLSDAVVKSKLDCQTTSDACISPALLFFAKANNKN
mgnify:CR=1 FL=1